MSDLDKSNTQPKKAKKPSRSQLRSASRGLALQAIYQWQMNHSAVNEIETQFTLEQDMSACDKVYFRDLLQGVTAKAKELDSLFEELLDRALSELDAIELAVLRIGSYELAHRLDVPYRVAINESVELAKSFGASESHKYVNGILDKLAQRVRREEIAARRNG
ncbi:transcription antitermination factor NusB [Marinomonas mediterranea]|jgi:transcription antitermination factor NusB|uniref:Transcription antitermination protein NusB n=1 Tax=Marinomonas mediterranea (strain ATCC 700492 / JCM 21426 / NBRC 103028 / MMB-1) TaxID=717774 RepID=F2JZL4_MARM1|nr:transcription antitermination factor NusB [Marinomonas mediterranea]ADZ89797.1 NusB antitermination factor [Marinomonas mediterranea MMB-1]WCN07886.1 transcription antitermination factor NusB [Marinomonas mediterranea]WCN11981.1 transcription antitermination factor NusB [Marinomonas mediterranea]WCN16018.1 transcription antitermination factor NusB [Marinomonas mediterranea MMB-1]